MKKLTNLLFVTLIVGSMTQFAFAQEQGELSVGAGVAYGFDIEEIGIQVNSIYTLSENIRVGADFIYWLTDDEIVDNEKLVNPTYEVNANFHYLFYNENDLVLYGLGSLGFHYTDTSINSESKTDTALGLGLGAGLEYNLGGIKLYTEPRIFLSGLDQFQLSVGVRLPI